MPEPGASPLRSLIACVLAAICKQIVPARQEPHGHPGGAAMHASIVSVRNFDSAVDFMDALSPRIRPWYPDADSWVFRGQRDAGWKLLPSASRPDAWRDFGRVVGSLPPPGHLNDARLWLELGAACRFAFEADRHGLHIPGFDHTMVEYSDWEAKIAEELHDVFAGRGFFPRPSSRPLLAMAQHYGIPTRLLDWSERPLVAAYFAASGAAGRSADPGTHFAVWALHRRRLRSLRTPDEEVIVFSPLWATNPNLRAQRGLFTVHGTRLKADQTATDVPLDVTIEKLAGIAPSTDRGDAPIICQFCLPVEKAPLLLRLLAEQGVSAASIFPGYAGVVESLREDHGVANYRDDPTEAFGRQPI